jgi:virginiamycin B lyase
MRARVTAAVALGLLATTAAAEPKTHVFPVPEGAHPHDVAPAPDGAVWYTAQNQGALGILDPRRVRCDRCRWVRGRRPMA